jgi:hypothetical protein
VNCVPDFVFQMVVQVPATMIMVVYATLFVLPTNTQLLMKNKLIVVFNLFVVERKKIAGR